jgi:hypothetical protein
VIKVTIYLSILPKISHCHNAMKKSGSALQQIISRFLALLDNKEDDI